MEKEKEEPSKQSILYNSLQILKNAVSYPRVLGVIILTGTTFGLVRFLTNKPSEPQIANHEQALETSTNSYDMFNTAKSATLFHVSILYNKIKYGNAFTFNQITQSLQPDSDDSVVRILKDNSDKLTQISDGKKIPIILGSIAKYQEDISLLKKQFNLRDEDGILILTLNRQFECDWAGLSALVKNDKTIKQFWYPTTDYSAPLLVDMLRAIRDLAHRDQYADKYKLAYVHCKAGRGRSAAIVIGYLLYLCSKVNCQISIQELEQYLKSFRPQVSLNNHHINTLKTLQSLLNNYSFEQLCEKYKMEIEKRDAEILSFSENEY